MANIWASPSSGNITNNGQPWHRGDTIDIQLTFSAQPGRVDLIGGSLPPGISFNSATRKIFGVVGALPKEQNTFPVVFRAYDFNDSSKSYDRSFRFIVDPLDEEQSWVAPGGIKDLGTINRGSSVTIPLDIVNPDMDNLVFKAVGVRTNLANTFAGLPYGLEIDQPTPDIVRIIGAATVTDNTPGTYYFKVYARDTEDLTRNPQGEGSPRTSETTYRITVSQDIVLDARLSDTVRWETPAGSLGSTYETYPSHFAIKASPQYEISGSASTESQSIRYTMVLGSNPLPDGLLLNPDTGFIIGRCPYVAVNQTFEFTVEARVVFVNNDTGAIRLSSVASQRTFSITIRNIFGVDSVTTLEVNVPGDARKKIAKWVWGNFPEPRPEYEAVTLEYQGDGVTTDFAAPTGKTGDTINVLIEDQLAQVPYSQVNVNGTDYIRFTTGVTDTRTDLSSWTNEGNGNWTLSNDNQSVYQSINGNATIFYSDYTAFGRKLSGTIQVAANAGDDDFIGFVVGFQPGDINDTDTDYILIDWKKGVQGTTPLGFAVSRVKKGLNVSGGGWNHTSSLGITELARGNNFGQRGWEHGRSYSFDIEYTPNTLKVFVDGALEASIIGSFPDGRFGFYNNSQGGVTYAGIATTSLAPPDGVTIKLIRYVNTGGSEGSNYLTILGKDNIYRASDQYFGKKRDYRILLAAGLNYVNDGNFLDKLKDYHHVANWRIGKVGSSRAKSPEGIHLYDVIYLTIIDPMVGSAGFDSGNKEVNLSRYVAGQKKTAIPQWNLSADDAHYFPNSIRNMRLDLHVNTNRQPWPEQGQSAASRGYGMVGREGLPLWMMSEQETGKPASVPGYQTVIELAHVRPGIGPAIVRALEQAGMNEDLQGTTITVDRYLLLSDGFSSTTFDFDELTGTITTFDGPDNAETPTVQFTTFDKSLQSESKYYKFPPGDK